jgi:hypothetical protein
LCKVFSADTDEEWNVEDANVREIGEKKGRDKKERGVIRNTTWRKGIKQLFQVRLGYIFVI